MCMLMTWMKLLVQVRNVEQNLLMPGPPVSPGNAHRQLAVMALVKHP